MGMHVNHGYLLSRLLKKPHMLRCPRSPRSNVTPKYDSARRFFGRLASEDFLSSLQSKFFITLLVMAQRLNPESSSVCDLVCQLSRNLLQPPQRSKRLPAALVLRNGGCCKGTLLGYEHITEEWLDTMMGVVAFSEYQRT
jgi:hypothetical protein